VAMTKPFVLVVRVGLFADVSASCCGDGRNYILETILVPRLANPRGRGEAQGVITG